MMRLENKRIIVFKSNNDSVPISQKTLSAKGKGISYFILRLIYDFVIADVGWAIGDL